MISGMNNTKQVTYMMKFKLPIPALFLLLAILFSLFFSCGNQKQKVVSASTADVEKEIKELLAEEPAMETTEEPAPAEEAKIEEPALPPAAYDLHTQTDFPPIGSKAEFLAWAKANTKEEEKFHAMRWDRLQVDLGWYPKGTSKRVNHCND